MKSISKQSGFENMGGVLKVWAIPPEVVSIQGSTVTVSDTNSVIELYCIPETANFGREKKKDNGNNYYDVYVSGTTICQNTADETILRELELRKWVVLFEDGNNRFKLAGTATERLTFLCDEDTGKSTADRNQVQFKFVGKIISRPFFTENPFVYLGSD